MNLRLRILIKGSLALCALGLSFSAEAQSQADLGAPAKIFGEVRLTTDSIEHGLTQSDHSLALQTGVGYKWPQFKVGLWGSNVKYTDSTDNLNLRLYLATKLAFNLNADLNIRYDFNRYSKEGYRDGAIVSLDLRLYDYHVLYEQNDNWEGYGATGARYGFSREWKIPYDFYVSGNVGYNMLQVTKLDNYFDLRVQASYKTQDIAYAMGASFNSKASQFNGRGDMALFVSAAATF